VFQMILEIEIVEEKIFCHRVFSVCFVSLRGGILSGATVLSSRSRRMPTKQSPRSELGIASPFASLRVFELRSQ